MAADGSDQPKPRRPPFSKLLAKAQAKVTVDQEVVFVHPSIPIADEPTEDTLVRGTVHLSLPKRRSARSVRVALHGICDAYGGTDWRYETTPTLSQQLTLELGGVILEEGDHAFDFSLLVPSTTAVWQRSSFGRVRHYLKATIELGSKVGSKITSPSTALYVLASAAPHGELPEPLDFEIQHYDEQLGPMAMAATSPHLTTSALLQVRLSFLAPAHRIHITSIRTAISQAFTVFYVDPTKIAHPHPRRFTLPVLYAAFPATTSPSSSTSSLALALAPTSSSLLSTGSAEMYGPSLYSSLPTSPLATPYSVARSQERYRVKPVTLDLSPNKESQALFVVRVPPDVLLRPSTIDGTETKIRVRHSLMVEVRYRVLNSESEANGEYVGEEKVLRLGKGVLITSCCCLQNSTQLPTYTDSIRSSSETPSATLDTTCISTSLVATPPPLLPIRRAAENRCLCNMTLEELYDRGVVGIQRPGELNGDGLEVRRLQPGCEDDARSSEEPRREKSAAWASWAEMGE